MATEPTEPAESTAGQPAGEQPCDEDPFAHGSLSRHPNVQFLASLPRRLRRLLARGKMLFLDVTDGRYREILTYLRNNPEAMKPYGTVRTKKAFLAKTRCIALKMLQQEQLDAQNDPSKDAVLKCPSCEARLVLPTGDARPKRLKRFDKGAADGRPQELLFPLFAASAAPVWRS